MTVGLATGSFVAAAGQTISLSSLFTVTAGAGNPQYLVVSGLDRNEYTAASTGSTGTLSGNGHSTGFSSIGGDSLGAGIVFTYDASTGQYANTTYGNLANVVLTASHDTNRNEAISLFATNNAANLTQYANDSYSLSQLTTYVGTVSVVTQPSGATPSQATPSQATPSSICSAAMSFVGQPWNSNGCWVLASNISAKAGASLPLTSTSLFTPGVANGEWIVAYNGPAGQTGDWQSLLKPGQIVAFGTSSTSGHITTVVSGTGASAMLVDNITYVNGNGSIANSANDGSANDVIVAAPHLASQEFSQAVAGSVVVYQLDTPTVTASALTPASVSTGSSTALSSLFTATDPGSRAVTQYQVYNTGTGGAANDSFLVNGVAQIAHSAATAITTAASALSATFLQAANAVGVDTLAVRAFNGLYWGDWQSVTVNVSSSGAPAPAPASTPAAPQVTAQTGTQVWMSRQGVSFTVAANTFTDPQGLGMTYSARQIAGRAMPWLRFDAATETFSGVSRGRLNTTIVLQVTATNSAGQSTSEQFNVVMAPNAARFAQAVAAVHASEGVGAIASAAPAPNTLHALAAPVA